MGNSTENMKGRVVEQAAQASNSLDRMLEGIQETFNKVQAFLELIEEMENEVVSEEAAEVNPYPWLHHDPAAATKLNISAKLRGAGAISEDDHNDNINAVISKYGKPKALSFLVDGFDSEKTESLNKTQQMIVTVCDEVKDILLNKNRKYGDSAINPVRLFSKASPEEQINVRLDDKVSRIESGQLDDEEDPELDIIGYLLLKRVQRALAKEPA